MVSSALPPAPGKLCPLTLRKSSFLKNKADFDTVKEKGRRFSDPYFTVLIARAKETPDPDGFRFGIICSRKFHKRAVVRNRTRRIVREAIRLLQPRILPCRMILIPRHAIFLATMPQVQGRLLTLLTRAGSLDSSLK